MAGIRDFEGLRRLRLGELKKLFRVRYGPTLPDDDAGLADLYELLLLDSMRSNPKPYMGHTIEIWAPWMDDAATRFDLVRQIETTPISLRLRTAKNLGERLNLRNEERERLNIRTIAANDMTDEEMAAWRKAKKNLSNRLHMQRKRRKAGVKSRTAYLATSLTKLKPWVAAGTNRTSWYRDQRVGQVRGRINSSIRIHEPVSPRQVRGKKVETVKGKGLSKKVSNERDETVTERDTNDCESKSTPLSHITDESKRTDLSHEQSSTLPESKIYKIAVGCRVFVKEIVPVLLGPPGDDMRDFQ